MPPDRLTFRKDCRPGFFVTRLIAPPVEPRPKRTEDGPKKTSTPPRLKVSRVNQPRSRTPSRNVSVCAEKPRRLKESPWRPPSPALIVMPETLRRASRSVVACCCSSTTSGTTVTLCGVLTSGLGRRVRALSWVL